MTVLRNAEVLHRLLDLLESIYSGGQSDVSSLTQASEANIESAEAAPKSALGRLRDGRPTSGCAVRKIVS